MNYEKSIAASAGKVLYKGFLGINRRMKTEGGEFYDMENMSHSEYPCIRSERGYKSAGASLEEDTVIKKLIIPRRQSGGFTGFTGVASYTQNSATYNGIFVDNENKCTLTEFTDAVDYNGSIIALPQFNGYVYAMEANASNPNEALIYPQSNSWSMYCYNEYPSSSASNYVTQLKLTEVPNSWYTSTFSKRYAVGENIVLYGLKDSMAACNTIYPRSSVDYSNITSPVSIVIKSYSFSGSNSSGTITIVVELRNVKGEVIPWPASVSSNSGAQYGAIKKYMPKVTYGCVAHNRIWCCSENGEEVLASALGKPLEYYEFNGVSTDSWNVSVGTPGRFTGIAPWQSRVIVFKTEYTQVIYGTTPNDFGIERTYNIGCIDRQSIANAGGMLIWLSYDGFYAYGGGMPEKISDKLNTKYVSAVAFTDGIRYYARCEQENGEKELIVYDTKRGLWSKLSDMDIVSGDFYEGKLYVCTQDSMYIMKEGEYGDFYMESPELTFDTFHDKSIICATIRCKINSGFINFYTSVNGGEWVAHRAISQTGKHRLPIRYSPGDILRFRIEGSGDVCIMDMELEMLIKERS